MVTNQNNDNNDNDYDLDLQRFKNHQKVFPWKFVIKVILGLGLVAAVYYFTAELVERNEQMEREKLREGIEVEIAP